MEFQSRLINLIIFFLWIYYMPVHPVHRQKTRPGILGETRRHRDKQTKPSSPSAMEFTHQFVDVDYWFDIGNVSYDSSMLGVFVKCLRLRLTKLGSSRGAMLRNSAYRECFGTAAGFKLNPLVLPHVWESLLIVSVIAWSVWILARGFEVPSCRENRPWWNYSDTIECGMSSL